MPLPHTPHLYFSFTRNHLTFKTAQNSPDSFWIFFYISQNFYTPTVHDKYEACLLPIPPPPTKKRHSIPMDASFPLCAINAERNLSDHTQSRRGVRKEPNLTGFNFSGFDKNKKKHNSTKVLRITSFCNCLQLRCTNKKKKE